MKLLFLAAAAAPLIETGEMSGVMGGLARALAAQGHEVMVVVPFTGRVDRARWAPRLAARVAVPRLGGDQVARVHSVDHAGVTYHLVAGPPVPRARRADLPAEAQIFTALAALGLCRALDWTPDVVHGCDPLSGPALYWLATDGLHDPRFQATASVFTLDRLAGWQGGAARGLLQYGLTPSDAPDMPEAARDALLGLALAHADALATLSAAYAGEVLSPAHGHGLEGLLQARAARLAALPAALDPEACDPARDRELSVRFDGERLERRAGNKRALQKALGLPPQAGAPLVGLIGAPLPLEAPGPAWGALRALLAQADAVQVVVAGGPPEARALAQAHPDRVRALAAPAPALRHRLHAAADVLLLPARTAPTGLAALRAMRYGAVPVAAAVGGHLDLIIEQSVPRRGTGFLFSDYNEDGLLAALQRALRLYAQPARWRALQQRGLRQAWHPAWDRSTAAHLALYQQATTYRKEAVTRRSRLLADDPAAPAPGLLAGPFAGPGWATLR